MTTTDTLTQALGGTQTREATMRVVPIQSASSERLVMLLKLRAMDDREDFVARLNLYAHQVGMVEQLRLDFDQLSQREVA